jgi:hypothetical protein
MHDDGDSQTRTSGLRRLVGKYHGSANEHAKETELNPRRCRRWRGEACGEWVDETGNPRLASYPRMVWHQMTKADAGREDRKAWKIRGAVRSGEVVREEGELTKKT